MLPYMKPFLNREKLMRDFRIGKSNAFMYLITYFFLKKAQNSKINITAQHPLAAEQLSINILTRS
ncbi:MAG: hypothetical protein Q4C97_07915, partial [Bacillota bacterium]|nr:hypothetical protein [Bacillota bacterium]